MRPFSHLFFIVLVCLSVSPSWSQRSQTDRSETEQGFQEFRELFDEIISRSLEDTASARRSFYPYPERLPSWLLSIPPGSDDHLYVVAASDPGMDNDTATELALFRATIMFGILAELTLTHLREFYSSERGDEITHVFTEYTRLNGSIHFVNEQVEVVKKHMTQYDETIILARIPASVMNQVSVASPPRYIEAGLYTRLRVLGNRMQLEERLNIDAFPEDGTLGRRYNQQYAMINRIVNTTTTMDDMLMSDLPALNLRYSMRAQDLQYNTKAGDRQQDGVSLRNGFWHALIAGMFSNMVDAAHEGSIHFSQLGDVYDTMLLSMSREFTRKTLVSSMPDLYVEENTLYLAPFVREIKDHP